MQRDSSIFSRTVITLLASAALAVCLGWLPGTISQEVAKQRPGTEYLLYLFLAYVTVLSIPFFFGLYQGVKLLSQLDGNQTFPENSAGPLRWIKFSALAVSALLVAGIAALLVLARGKDEDLTGIVAPALLVTLLSTGVAIMAAVVQQRMQQATGGR